VEGNSDELAASKPYLRSSSEARTLAHITTNIEIRCWQLVAWPCLRSHRGVMRAAFTGSRFEESMCHVPIFPHGSMGEIFVLQNRHQFGVMMRLQRMYAPKGRVSPGVSPKPSSQVEVVVRFRCSCAKTGTGTKGLWR
jgi:hypothetical protein